MDCRGRFHQPERIPPKRSSQIVNGLGGVNTSLPRNPYIPWNRWWCTRMFDTVKTRLEPRLENLEGCDVPAYVDALAELDTAQGELEEAASSAENSKDLAVLKDFASELTEALKCVEGFNGEIGSLSKRLRPSPEDLDKAEAEVKQEGMVKGQDKSALSLATLLAAKSAWEEWLEIVPSAGERALVGFATFLRSPGVVAALRRVPKPSSGLTVVVEAKSDKVSWVRIAASSNPSCTHFACPITGIFGQHFSSNPGT